VPHAHHAAAKALMPRMAWPFLPTSVRMSPTHASAPFEQRRGPTGRCVRSPLTRASIPLIPHPDTHRLTPPRWNSQLSEQGRERYFEPGNTGSATSLRTSGIAAVIREPTVR
jgi:hypothetical protein